jgi:uncharacterized protein
MLAHQNQFAGRGDRVVRQSVFLLTEADREDALTLLNEDPIGAVYLIGMLEDYGVAHTAHRGQFFGYYENRKLAGVAMLGHFILIYGKEDSVPYFAKAAIESKAEGHVIFGPRKQVELFWSYIEKYQMQTRLVRDYHWYVNHRPATSPNRLQLRQARLEDLESVADAHAEMAFEGSGLDPRVTDWQGFHQRIAERIKRGRVWVKIEDGKCVFKADLFNQTAETNYLEGVWTHPDYRGKGIATECLTELVHRLCRKGAVLCLVAELNNRKARRVYEKVGFVPTKEYQARYLKPLEA